jgi:hypothetical protein
MDDERFREAADQQGWKDADLDGGRGPDEELALPGGTGRSNFSSRNKNRQADEDDDGSGGGNGCGGVKDDTEGAVIRVSIDGMDVGNLDDGEHGEKRQTHQHHDVGS